MCFSTAWLEEHTAAKSLLPRSREPAPAVQRLQGSAAASSPFSFVPCVPVWFVAAGDSQCHNVQKFLFKKTVDIRVNVQTGRGGSYLLQQVWSSNSNCAFFSCSLENCGITSDSCRDISAVLSNKSSLIDLSVGDNKIGDSGLALLCHGLLHPHCRIQKLW